MTEVHSGKRYSPSESSCGLSNAHIPMEAEVRSGKKEVFLSPSGLRGDTIYHLYRIKPML